MQNEQGTDRSHFDEAGRRSSEFLRDFMKQQRAALLHDAERDLVDVDSEPAV